MTTLMTSSRDEIEFNHAWMTNHPELFAAAVVKFHAEHPVRDWRHCVDMSLSYTVKFVAIRRETPFLDTQEYLAHSNGNLYLREIGMR